MTLKERAARALDLTHGMDNRGPTTFMCRFFLADWLDGRKQKIKLVKKDIQWLEGVIKADFLIK